MPVLSREALFADAWTRPLTEIAAELGISDVGLRKICDRHDIPTPGRGYWAQVRAGKSYARPKLRPAKHPSLEQVVVSGGPALPPAVRAAMQRAREPAAQPPPRRTPTPAEATDAPAPAAAEDADAPAARPQPDVERQELRATVKALARARPDADGFLSVSGGGVVSLKIGPESQAAALGFLAALLVEADVRGWSLEVAGAPASLKVEGETLAVRLEESPKKTPHTPTPKQLAEKARRDRWGGDSQPWPTWDLSPSGRLAFIIDENSWSGLRRTFSQRKGHALSDSLELIAAGLAGHAAFKAERRREEAARAAAAALAEARRQRLQAFEHREKRRMEFAEAIRLALEERARLRRVLDHLAAAAPGETEEGPAGMAAWLRRRLAALDARLELWRLRISARHAEVGFEEPPRGEPASRWYAPAVELHLWIPAEEAGRVSGVSELEWAIAEGLIADPGAPPAESNPGADNSD